MRMVHPLTSAVYESEDDGTVRVTDKDGRQGWFSPSADHVRGELLSADPHIIDWVGGPQARKQTGRLRLESKSSPAGTD